MPRAPGPFITSARKKEYQTRKDGAFVGTPKPSALTHQRSASSSPATCRSRAHTIEHKQRPQPPKCRGASKQANKTSAERARHGNARCNQVARDEATLGACERKTQRHRYHQSQSCRRWRCHHQRWARYCSHRVSSLASALEACEARCEFGKNSLLNGKRLSFIIQS